MITCERFSSEISRLERKMRLTRNCFNMHVSENRTLYVLKAMFLRQMIHFYGYETMKRMKSFVNPFEMGHCSKIASIPILPSHLRDEVDD